MSCLKSPNSSEFAIFLTIILNYVYCIMLYQLFNWSFKSKEIKKIKSHVSDGIRTRNLWVWGYGTPAQ